MVNDAYAFGIDVVILNQVGPGCFRDGDDAGRAGVPSSRRIQHQSLLARMGVWLVEITKIVNGYDRAWVLGRNNMGWHE